MSQTTDESKTKDKKLKKLIKKALVQYNILVYKLEHDDGDISGEGWALLCVN